MYGPDLRVYRHAVRPDVTAEAIWAIFLQSSGGQIVVDTLQPELRFVARDLRRAYQFLPLVPTTREPRFSYLYDVRPRCEEPLPGSLNGALVAVCGWRLMIPDQEAQLRAKYGNFSLEFPFSTPNMGHYTADLRQMSPKRATYELFHWVPHEPRSMLQQMDQIFRAGHTPLLEGYYDDPSAWAIVKELVCTYDPTNPNGAQGDTVPAEWPRRDVTPLAYS